MISNPYVIVIFMNYLDESHRLLLICFIIAMIFLWLIKMEVEEHV